MNQSLAVSLLNDYVVTVQEGKYTLVGRRQLARDCTYLPEYGENEIKAPKITTNRPFNVYKIGSSIAVLV